MREKINSQQLKAFISEVAKKWQDYIPYDFIQGIELSPEQIRVVDLMDTQLMINGSAGSGKSITLLYKMIRTMVQEAEPQRILYLSYNQSLVEDARKRAKRSKQFMEYKSRHYVDINTFHGMVTNLLEKMSIKVKYISMKYDRMEESNDDAIRRITSAMHPYVAKEESGYLQLDSKERLYKTHTAKFVRDEVFWLKANGFITEDAYLDAPRAGRGTIPRLEKAQRSTIFKIYEKYQQDLKYKYGGQMDLEDYALELLKVSGRIPDQYKYDYIYIDEVQDLQPMQIKALTSIVKKQIVISGDNKQRIYKTSNHTYEALGLGSLRRRNLLDNFRSTKQIMELANSIQFKDLDKEKETNVRYVRNGPIPKVIHFKDPKKYMAYLVERIKSIQNENSNSTIAVIIRNDDYVNKGIGGSPIEQHLKMYFSTIDIKQYGQKFSYEEKQKQLVVTDPYSVKGLEFDYVFVMQFDIFHYPLKSKLQAIDEFMEDKNRENEGYKRDREEIINNEKRILYVAMSRAKKELELMYVNNNERACCDFIDISKADFIQMEDKVRKRL